MDGWMDRWMDDYHFNYIIKLSFFTTTKPTQVEDTSILQNPTHNWTVHLLGLCISPIVFTSCALHITLP
jgi:hypothetical protein